MRIVVLPRYSCSKEHLNSRCIGKFFQGMRKQSKERIERVPSSEKCTFVILSSSFVKRSKTRGHLKYSSFVFLVNKEFDGTWNSKLSDEKHNESLPVCFSFLSQNMNEYQTKALYRKYDIESPLTELIGGQQSVQIMKYRFFLELFYTLITKIIFSIKLEISCFFLNLSTFS